MLGSVVRVHPYPPFIPPESSFIVLISLSFQLNAQEYGRQYGRQTIIQSIRSLTKRGICYFSQLVPFDVRHQYKKFKIVQSLKVYLGELRQLVQSYGDGYRLEQMHLTMKMLGAE